MKSVLAPSTELPLQIADYLRLVYPMIPVHRSREKINFFERLHFVQNFLGRLQFDVHNHDVPVSELLVRVSYDDFVNGNYVFGAIILSPSPAMIELRVTSHGNRLWDLAVDSDRKVSRFPQYLLDAVPFTDYDRSTNAKQFVFKGLNEYVLHAIVMFLS